MTPDEALELRPGDLVVGHNVHGATYFLSPIDYNLMETMNKTDTLMVLGTKPGLRRTSTQYTTVLTPCGVRLTGGNFIRRLE